MTQGVTAESTIISEPSTSIKMRSLWNAGGGFNDPPPDGWETLAFDDSGWVAPQAAVLDVPLTRLERTLVPTGTPITALSSAETAEGGVQLLRHHFTVPDDVVIGTFQCVVEDQLLGVWVNGAWIGTQTAATAFPDSDGLASLVIPVDILNTAGADNVLAAQFLYMGDTGFAQWIDYQIVFGAVLATIGENPPDPGRVAAWTQPVGAGARFAFGFGTSFHLVLPVTDVGQVTVWQYDNSLQMHAVPVRNFIPQVTDFESGVTHNAIPIFYEYVSWPDDVHGIDGATWIHDGGLVGGIGAWERAGDVTYFRHHFWVPDGLVSDPGTLQFGAVDFAREVWLNGTQLYANNADYRLTFNNYDVQSLSVPDGLLSPGQWNLLTIKVQHHVNLIEEVVGPYFQNRIPIDVVENNCDPPLRGASFYSEDPPFGATQFKFSALLAHMGRYLWNGPFNPDSILGILYLENGFNLSRTAGFGTFSLGPFGPDTDWAFFFTSFGTRDALMEVTNTYQGGIVAPAAYALYPTQLFDWWAPGADKPACNPRDQLLLAFRVWLWDVAWYGPVHQHSGAIFRLDAEIESAVWIPTETTIGTPLITDAVDTSVTAGSNTAYVLNGSGQVLAFGAGSAGALGQGDEVNHFAMPPVVVDCGGLPVQKLMQGSGDTFSMFAVTYNGELWGWGLDALLLAQETGALSAVRVLPADFEAGSVLDVVVMAENVVFVRRSRAGSTRQGARAWSSIVG